MFLRISQNSQENTCAWVSFFNKVAGFTSVLLWGLRNVKNTIFTAQPHPTPSQPAFTCSKLTTETLEQGVKNVQS